MRSRSSPSSARPPAPSPAVRCCPSSTTSRCSPTRRVSGSSSASTTFTEPPASTARTGTRPDQYLKGLRGGSAPAPILARPAGCTTIRSGTLGRFLMGELLQQTPQAQGALDGWNGDAFAVFACPDWLAMVELWQADSEDDASALATALSSSWSRAWSGASAAPSSVGRFTGRSGAGIIAVRAGEVTLDLAQTPLALDELGPLTRPPGPARFVVRMLGFH